MAPLLRNCPNLLIALLARACPLRGRVQCPPTRRTTQLRDLVSVLTSLQWKAAAAVVAMMAQELLLNVIRHLPAFVSVPPWVTTLPNWLRNSRMDSSTILASREAIASILSVKGLLLNGTSSNVPNIKMS